MMILLELIDLLMVNGKEIIASFQKKALFIKGCKDFSLLLHRNIGHHYLISLND